VIGKIAYDEAFTKAQIIKASVVEYTGGAITEQIKALWRQVTYALGLMEAASKRIEGIRTLF